MTKKFVVYLFAIITFFAGCAAQEDTVPVLDGDSGKADGVVFSVRDYFAHTLNLDLSDLEGRIARMATKELNASISGIPFTTIALEPTEVFAGADVAAEDSTIGNLEQLSVGLTAQYGEKDFVSKVNRIRVEHLNTSGDRYYAESTFQVQLKADGSFELPDVGNLDVAVGFNPQGTLVARTVSAHEPSDTSLWFNASEVADLILEPLNAVYAARGFILPTSLSDLSDLKPGESISLSGHGVVGFNIGANLPVFAFDPTSYVRVSARFHLGAWVQMLGDIDYHLIRGTNDTLYLDVGISNRKLNGYRVALKSGWGLYEVPSLLEVELAGKRFALGDIAAAIIKNKIDRAGLLDYGVEGMTSNEAERITLHRYEVNLKSAGPMVETALSQAVSGDLRLLQSLSDRANSGILERVSFERSIDHHRSYRGLDVASMRFFKDINEYEGSVYLEHNNQVDEIVFDEFSENTGKFFSDWGYTRAIVTSQTWEGGSYRGAASNLRISVTEGDRFTERDKVLDHVDAALLSVMDFTGLYEDLTRKFEELQHEVDKHCPDCNDEADTNCDFEYKQCLDTLLSEGEINTWKMELLGMTDAYLKGVDNTGYNPEFHIGADVAGQLLDLKLELAAVQELKDALADTTGRTSMITDMRFSQEGLNHLFRMVDPAQFETRLRDVLTLLVSKRSRDYDKKYDAALDWLAGEEEKIEKMVSIFRDARSQYLRLDDLAGVRVQGFAIGDEAAVVTVASDDSSLPTVQTIAAKKGQVAAKLFDDLVEEADDLSLIESIVKLLSLGLIDMSGFESHHLVAYTMLSLVPADYRECLMTMDFENDDFADVQLYTRGVEDSSFINPGHFDLWSLLK
ncbi:MAG: hypothetical protein CMH54_12385 [Myxococcales bacterium]|nr:hypothetical protein [Myxococcales bacterium]